MSLQNGLLDTISILLICRNGAQLLFLWRLPTQRVNSPRYINLCSSFSSMSGHVLSRQTSDLLTINSACELETKASIYLAQASLSDLPSSLLEDLPTPELVSKAGKGDVYDTSIWLGQAPTYTPLHRDPNPNLFVQLAGKKQVRLFKPDLGNAIFHHVQTSIGGAANATMRGAEMMEGAERTALEQAVWHPSSSAFWALEGLQCEVGPGDGLFIPKGWWHSIKGVGQGMIGSVNWWFR